MKSFLQSYFFYTTYLALKEIYVEYFLNLLVNGTLANLLFSDNAETGSECNSVHEFSVSIPLPIIKKA
jgi:hypothetical protein